jgi:hypothetical protein
MNIATYNLRAGGRRGDRVHWRRMMDSLAGRARQSVGQRFQPGGGQAPCERDRASHPPWLLERLRREFNLMSCWQAVHPNRDLAQTLRWARNPATPYHCDGVFVPAAWYRYLEDCQVITHATWEVLRDHNPVVVTLI